MQAMNSPENPIRMAHEDLLCMCRLAHLTLQGALKTLNEVTMMADTPGVDQEKEIKR